MLGFSLFQGDPGEFLDGQWPGASRESGKGAIAVALALVAAMIPLLTRIGAWRAPGPDIRTAVAK